MLLQNLGNFCLGLAMTSTLRIPYALNSFTTYALFTENYPSPFTSSLAEFKYLALQKLPRLQNLQGGMKFATKISPQLNLLFSIWCNDSMPWFQCPDITPPFFTMKSSKIFYFWFMLYSIVAQETIKSCLHDLNHPCLFRKVFMNF